MYNSMNHGLISNYQLFKKLDKESLKEIYYGILDKYDLLKFKDKRNPKVVSIKYAFYLVLISNKHKTTEVGNWFDCDHSTIIHGKVSMQNLLSVQDPEAIIWYKEVLKELKKYNYKDATNIN